MLINCFIWFKDLFSSWGSNSGWLHW